MSMRSIPAATLLLALAAAPSGPGLPAFEQAFRFASAIKTDPKDMAMAQEAVVLEIAHYVSIDEAIRRADQVEGWRRGVVYAELAKELALAGRTEEAKAFVDKAERVRRGESDWPNPRIASHIARALAVIGEQGEAQRITTALEGGDRQYSGRSGATAALGLARAGDYDGAMAQLRALEGQQDPDAIWARTTGYVEVGSQARLTKEQRAEALTAARASANDIAGWRRAEALIEVAEAQAKLGEKTAAAATLKEAQSILVAQSGKVLTIKGPLLAECGRIWALIGDAKKATAALQLAEQAAPETLNIEQPAIYAQAAGPYLAVGRPDEAARLWDKALSLAEGLTNARPRALAVVEICRAMGRAGYAIPEATQARIQALYAGLKDPW